MQDNFIKLPRGRFFMGTDDINARDREKPRHEVTIDYDIAMTKYLVTVEDYSDTPCDGFAYGVASDKGRVLRGGSYSGDADKCNCTSRTI